MNILRTLLLVMMSMGGCSCCSVSYAQLPPASDATKYQVIVVDKSAEVASWFDASPDLSKLKAATAFTFMKPKASEQARDGLFEARYRSVLGAEFPIVAYLRPDGGVVYFADKHSMPSRDRLFDEIKQAHLKAKDAARPVVKPQSDMMSESDWQEDCPDGMCPEPNSKPLFPRLRPFKNPLDDATAANGLFGGFITDTISSGLWLVFSGIFLIFIFLGIVLIVGAMIVVSKMW